MSLWVWACRPYTTAKETALVKACVIACVIACEIACVCFVVCVRVLCVSYESIVLYCGVCWSVAVT